MKVWAVLVAMAVAAPALAVPPVEVPPTAGAVVEAYMEAASRNDLAAYAKLFSPKAKIEIESDTAPALNKVQWIESVAGEFTATRQTRFLNVFSGQKFAEGKRSNRILFIQEILDCPPNRTECFAVYRSETVTVMDGEIVEFQRAQDFNHRRTSPGDWTPFGGPYLLRSR